MNKKDRKDREGQGGGAPIKREYSSVDFNDLVNDALGLINQQEKMEEEKKHMKAIEQDLIRMMHNNEWQRISEFKYRYPHLKIWVDELEYSYWSQRDYINSHRQQ